VRARSRRVRRCAKAEEERSKAGATGAAASSLAAPATACAEIRAEEVRRHAQPERVMEQREPWTGGVPRRFPATLRHQVQQRGRAWGAQRTACAVRAVTEENADHRATLAVLSKA
jgi:hypothetical protein